MCIRFVTVFVICALITFLADADERCTFASQRVQCGALSCQEATGLCVPCRLDSDCYEESMECIGGKCHLGNLMEHFSVKTFGTLLAAVGVCAVAVVAGIGGGGILVPLFASLLGVPLPVAVSLSQATICGQSVLNMSVQIFRKHPDNVSRPIVNYQYLSLLLPLSLAGTLLGSAFSKVIPDWLRMAMLFTLLTAVLHRVIERAKRQYRSDKIRAAAAAAASGEDNASKEMQQQRPPVPAASSGVVSDNAISREQFDQFPRYELGMSLVSFTLLLLFNVALSNVECGSAGYIALFVLPVALLTGGYLHARGRLVRLWADVSAGSVHPDTLTFHWSAKTTIVFPMIAAVAGGAATMLGIGGGLVLSFVLFEAGLSPEEASSSSGMATLLIATESALQMYIQNQLPQDFGLLFFFGGLLSAVIGQSIFIPFIKKNDFKFLIIVALGVVVGGSLIALTSFGIYGTVVLLQHDGSLLSFGHFCKKM